MLGLDQRMSVYTPNENDDGDYTALALSNEPCRLLTRMDKGTQDANEDRPVQTGLTPLLWGPAYTMPNTAQVLINGKRWNVVPNTQEEGRTIGGGRVYWRCDVVQAVD